MSVINGKLCLTVPWLVEYLSMMDNLAPNLDYFQQVLFLLLYVHRYVWNLNEITHTKTVTGQVRSHSTDKKPFVRASSSSIWATSRQNQQNDCAPSEDSDQPGHPPSLMRVFPCAQWVAKDPSFLHADSEDSDQTERMANLSLCRAHRSFCWFCRAAAQLLLFAYVMYPFHIGRVFTLKRD